MTTELRQTGIRGLGEMPWGTHLCCFYETKQGLLDTLTPYFQAGLETNERCVWVLSAALSAAEVRDALRTAVRDLDRYQADGSLEVVAGREWYPTSGHLNERRAEGSWGEKLNRALSQGYGGMRIAGAALWFEGDDWEDRGQYEYHLNQLLTGRPLTVLCTYQVTGKSATEILDIARTHQFVITKQKGAWDVMEATDGKQDRAQIKKLNEELEQRKQAEALLRKAQEKVRMILDSMTDRFFALDRDWRITDFNKHGEEQLRALGRDPTTVRGAVLWDVFPNPPVEHEFRRAMSQRAVITHEHYYPPTNEWVENRFYPSPDGGLAIFQRYVTESKRAEAALRDSEERYRLLVEGLKDYAIIMLDPEGRVTSWNKGAERIKGYKAEEIIGKHFSRFYSVEDIEWGKPDLALKTAAANGHYEDEGLSIRKDGTSFFAAVCITALIDQGGRLRGFSKLTRDLTQQKKEHEELRRSEAYLAQAQRLSHTGSWVFNIVRGEMYWSEEHFRICGLDPETVQPAYPGVLQWIHPDDRGFVQQTFENAIRDRRDIEADCRLVRPDGEIRYIHSLANPVFDEYGVLTEYVGTIMDMTEHKLAEEALQKTQAELAHAIRVLTVGEMATSMAHEMNQPLAAIVTNGDACLRWLRRETPDLDEARDAVERVIENAIRASEVIKRIRSLVRKTAPEEEPLNVNEIVQEAIAFTAGELRKNHVRLQMELQADLPPVVADRVQLQQVLLNLILNSNDAMSGVDCPTRELAIRSEESEAGEVMVAVRDSGAGLHPRDTERVFESFYSTKPGGLGLGLSISRTIVESYGGRLWAEQNTDKGATFRFILPARGASPSRAG